MPNFIYKPITDKSSKGSVLLTPPKGRGSAPTATLPDGRVITAVPGSKAGGIDVIEDGQFFQWAFKEDLTKYENVKLSYNGQETEVPGGQSFEGDGFGSWQPRSKGSSGQYGGTGGSSGGGGGYQSGSTYGGGYNDGVAAPTFVDASGIQYPNVNFQNIPTPAYTPTDPLAFAQQAAQLNTQAFQQNLATAQNNALGLINTELQGLQSFAPQASQLQQGIVGQENQFNQTQLSDANQYNPTQITSANAFNQDAKTNSINNSGLGVRDSVEIRLADAKQRAKGFLPTSIQDRAFEMAARSRAGDDAVARGLGTSSFTQNAIDKYTVGERLNLAREGRADEAAILSEGIGLLVDAPIKYNPVLSNPLTARASQDVRGAPSLSGSQLASSQQQSLNQASIIDPGAALSAKINQDQFGVNLQNNVNQFNASGNLQASTTNAAGQFSAQLTRLQQDRLNAAGAYEFAQSVANHQYNQYSQSLADYSASTAQGTPGVNNNGNSLQDLISGISSVFNPATPTKKPGSSTSISTSQANIQGSGSVQSISDDYYNALTTPTVPTPTEDLTDYLRSF